MVHPTVPIYIESVIFTFEMLARASRRKLYLHPLGVLEACWPKKQKQTCLSIGTYTIYGEA
jgi:hypothetical protein